jgi:hypothetical protein
LELNQANVAFHRLLQAHFYVARFFQADAFRPIASATPLPSRRKSKTLSE